MPEIKTNQQLKEGCAKCLKYFGIFKYPLTPEEIHTFNPMEASMENVQAALEELLVEEIVFKHDDFFMLQDQAAWAEERKRGNRRAYALLDRSKKFVRIIASFPFVRAIAISGSLSKFYASKNPDIDYFIITRANRLWIARTFLHLFKKLTFLIGHEHYYCMNYFVDTGALLNQNQNLYGAIETVTLLPVYNKEMILEYAEMNDWSRNFLPNHPGIKNFQYLIKNRKRPLKSVLEALMNILFPDYMNRFWMKVTDRKWRKKWARHNYSEEDYERAFQTEIHISKNHPDDYEKKVLQSLENETQKQTQKQSL
ncbi:MAG: hypothetical protein K9G58_06825 [Bacteroidales bacterium]|nr:hypothetical protein [Bacteroidales bacterium]MCF8387215.1 hypothetical protein [Bacteroidales bacterium]MCF8397863.1 hypothetical protein [Bacteroidales bacterium]